MLAVSFQAGRTLGHVHAPSSLAPAQPEPLPIGGQDPEQEDDS